jgi:hypothetical protein
MSAKRTRALRAGVEGLERRETPSSVNLASAGTAAVTFSHLITNGQDVTTMISGKSKGLGGSYTGELDVVYALNNPPGGSGTGVITTSSGDTIDLKLKSETQTPHKQLEEMGTMVFSVTGGTGAYANATGHGVFTGNINILNNFRFLLHGRVRT